MTRNDWDLYLDSVNEDDRPEPELPDLAIWAVSAEHVVDMLDRRAFDARKIASYIRYRHKMEATEDIDEPTVTLEECGLTLAQIQEVAAALKAIEPPVVAYGRKA